MKYDYNQDGRVNPIDVAIIISVWRDCGHLDTLSGQWVMTEADISRVIREIYGYGK